MSVRRNIVANYLGAGISALAPILALPWYISILGPKQWGLISFIALLQGLLGLLNTGLSQALVREFAEKVAEKKKMAILLFGFERIYWIFAIVAALLMIISAGLITKYWLKLDNFPKGTGELVVCCAAAIFAVQFPVSIYRSVLMGCGEQIKQNIFLTIGILLKHVGGVVVVVIYKSIEAYLLWSVLAAFMETVLTAHSSWGVLGIKRSEIGWDFAAMKKVFALSLGLSISVLLGMLTMQMDKIVLSWSLPIEQLGYYSIASAVALGLLQLFNPISSAVLPKIVQSRFQVDVLRKLNVKLFLIMLGLVGLSLIGFLLVGKQLLNLWLRDTHLVNVIYPIIEVLLIGTGFNALYNVGYMNWLAEGSTSKIFRVNVVALVLSVILIPLLITKYGLVGAAFGWLVINSVGLLLSLDWIFNRGAVNAQNFT